MKNGFWQKNREYYKLEPLTEELVKEADRKLNSKLPQTYINLLREQNGGYINFDSYPTEVPTSWADDHIHIDHIFGIGEGKGILESAYLIKEWGLPNNVVLISGDGHSWVALDYRNTKEEPPVIFIDVDDEQIIELASNFDSFLNGLYINEVEYEDFSYEQDIENYSQEELKLALSTNNEQEIILALNYLYKNQKDNEHFIEQNLIILLQHSDLGIKQLVANFANHFNRYGILSSKGVEDIVSIIRNDIEIEYYADMYFRKN